MTRHAIATLPARAVLAALAVLALAGPALAQDPGATGPFAVTVEEYNFGDLAFSPSAFPSNVEVRGNVHYPTGLAGGPYPVVMLLHGRHATCYQGSSAALEWPCSGSRTLIPSYQGYNYFAEKLASHGYIVISISANGINAFDNGVFDLGMQARAELMQHHLGRWNTFNTTGGSPFGNKFVGKLDLQNVGTMGHSRGGEGVVQHYMYNRSLGSPYGIKAVFPLAPVDFNRPVPDRVPLKVLLPYCDGDVSDLQGVHFYDDARYAVPNDPAAKFYMLVMGANHNYYNTVWTPGLFPAGAGDDWGTRGDSFCDSSRPSRLTATEQRGTGLAYMAAFFRTYLGGETAFLDILKGDAAPPPSAQGADIYLSYHAPGDAASRRDVNRLLDSSALTTNTLGGAVTRSGFTPYDMCGGAGQPTPCLPTQTNSRQPHTTPSARSSAPGLSQLRGGWSASTANYTNNIPAGSRDVTGFAVLQFRAGVNFEDARSVAGQAINFTVRLTDGAGTTADVEVASHSDSLFYPPGSASAVPKVVLHTIRLPLSAFTGLDKTDVRSIQFRFDQTGSGALLFSDLAFADPTGVVPDPADLIVSSLSNPPASAASGGSFSVSDTVTNQGVGAAGGSTTRYYLSLDASKSGGDTLLSGTRAVPGLSPGAASSGTVSVTIPSVAANSYFLLACADDTGAVVESVENNNCRASTTTVAVSAPLLPDLVVTSVGNPPASAFAGASFTAADTVTNSGAAAAGASTTRYYLSSDASKSGGDTLLTGTRAVPGLAIGANSAGTASVTIPVTPAGSYFLLACADDTGAVTESAEGNNCAASVTQLTILAPGQPDLGISSLSNPPATIVLGQAFTVTDTTANAGSGAAVETGNRFYLSVDQTRGKDKRLKGLRAVPALAGFASSSGSSSITVPAAVPRGTYYLIGCADDFSSVVEASETNNCRTSTTTVQVLAPDLVESALNNPPATAPRGSSFTATDTVRNNGDAAAGASTTRYYLSADTTKDGSDTRLTGDRLVASLAPSATSSGSVSVTVPAGTPPGTYRLLACADDKSKVVESGGKNNCRASTTTVVVP